MSDVTQILSAIEQGDPKAAEKLLPLVYAELRNLAAAKLSREKSGQTLQATALVHEAYLRVADVAKPQCWESRRHFFAAAAEAMRRILVENARRKASLKRGGHLEQIDLNLDHLQLPAASNDISSIDEALRKLARERPRVAKLVELRFFAGLTMDEAAACLEISSRTAHRYWTYARAWLHAEIHEATGETPPAH